MAPTLMRLLNLSESDLSLLVDMAQSCVMFYNDFTDFESDQASKVFSLESKLILDDLYTQLKVLEHWNAENIHSVINNICETRGVGFGKVGQPFRLALSGMVKLEVLI